MDSVTLKAPAKINLSLRILSRRADGFHELDTVFLPLAAPCDLLEVTPAAPGAGLILSCSDPGLAGPDNLVARAYSAFVLAAGCAPDLAVHLVKDIPAGAGLGGGSSDAAALLRHLNSLAGDRALPGERLTTLAARLGADVPFFLLGRPARGRGIGERLTPVDPDLEGLSLVLACPDAHVSTAWAYRRWDETPPVERSTRASGFLTTEARGTKNPSSLLPLAVLNDFEQVVFPAFPEIAAVKERLLADGAAASAMSGSGASVFALFRDREKARQAARNLERGQVRTTVQDLHWGVAKR